MTKPLNLLSIDYEKYLPYYDEYDMTLDEKRAHIEALWTIMQAFVDLAWGTDPTTLAMQEAERSGRKKRGGSANASKADEKMTLSEDLEALLAKFMAERGIDAG